MSSIMELYASNISILCLNFLLWYFLLSNIRSTIQINISLNPTHVFPTSTSNYYANTHIKYFWIPAGMLYKEKKRVEEWNSLNKCSNHMYARRNYSILILFLLFVCILTLDNWPIFFLYLSTGLFWIITPIFLRL